MAINFNVFYLGVLPIIDPDEGNQQAENADALKNMTIGDVGDPLFDRLQTLTPGSTRFDGAQPDTFFYGIRIARGAGSRAEDRAVYNQDNNVRSETFNVTGLAGQQTFDAAASFEAVITYIDGTTANISAVIFQATNGNTFLGPPQFDDSGQPDSVLDAFSAKPIRSITIGDVIQDTFIGLRGDRPDFFNANTIQTCYVSGTLIGTPTGDRPIETLSVGDLVMTKDHGARPIRWIGASTVKAEGKLAPVRIAAGALGTGLPARDLLVSRQHRMLVCSKIAERMFGATEILVPAIKLVGLPGVDIAATGAEVTYVHLMTDAHDVIFAESAPSETLLTGPMALRALGPDYLAEIEAIFPGISASDAVPARLIARCKKVDQLIARHQKNNVPLAA